MDGDQRAALDLGYQLGGIVDSDEFFRATAAMLSAVFACDGVSWTSIDLARNTVVLRGNPPELQKKPTADLLAHHASDHPIIASYLREPSVRPRRLSDVASRADLLRNGSYVEVMRPLGIRYQLSMMTIRGSQLTGGGWAFNDGAKDFTDEHVVIAGRIQQVLGMLGAPPPPAPPSPEARERLGLTDREIQVLTLVAEGHTAHAIGTLLRIAPATVRKHLQQLYAKLGVSDRLLAVRRAQESGLLATVSPPRPGGAGRRSDRHR